MTFSRCRLLVSVLLLVGASANAQAPQRSPIQDLLATARTALNDLRYTDADSIARAVLELQELRRGDRIQALQLLAGAAFPEQESAQNRTRAENALRRLVRIAPSATLPREVSWPGLEALHREARSNTFGVSVSPVEENVLIGPDQSGAIEVVASRPARFTLWLTPEGTTRKVLLDSAQGAATAALRFRVLEKGVPAFSTGPYRMTIQAQDLAAPDTISLSFPATIEAPPLQYVTVPDRMADGAMLPEITRPKRTLGIVGGILAFGATVAASRVLRDSDLKGASGGDGRVIGIGFALGLGTAGGVYLLDKGEPIPMNVESNRRTRAEFEQRVAEARARNAEMLRTYRAVVRIDREPLP
jgi:hypothetical protein